MKIISAKLHGIIDYLVVVFLLVSPTIFGFTDLLAGFTYALGGIHLILTLLTDFNAGLFKVIPLPLHGLIELVVGIVLVVLAYTVFNDTEAGMLFYTSFGAAVVLVWFLTDYKSV
jgi:hypothetical protein